MKSIKLSINNCNKNFSLKGNKRIQSFNVIHDILIKLNKHKKTIFLNQIKNKLNIKSLKTSITMMSYKDLNFLFNLGLDIQSHTKSHEYLPMLKQIKLEDEFFMSKIELSKIFGTAPIAISYPYGGFNDNVIKMASKHYNYGFITDNELLDLNKLKNDKRNSMKLSRINVTDQSPFELYFRINGFHAIVKSLFNKK